MALSNSSRERVLLEAGFLNLLGTILIQVGVLGPLASFVFFADMPRDRGFPIGVFVLLCLVGGPILHYMARLALKALDE